MEPSGSINYYSVKIVVFCLLKGIPADVNRVTVYRILDLLVGNRLVERISAGDRSFRYGLAPNANHQPHSHFYCVECGEMECLRPEHISLDTEPLERSSFPGLIERVEVRFDGICEDCRRQ